jgi:hypothetical protein
VFLARKLTGALSTTSPVHRFQPQRPLLLWSIPMEDCVRLLPMDLVRVDSPPKGIRPEAIPGATRQAILNLEVQDLEATITQQQQQQQQQIDTLTAQLKEQAAQIQKVNGQLEMSKPAAKVVANKAVP